MQKSKIAESIIIRVGGGIREVYREPLADTQDNGESPPNESPAEKSDAAQIFQIEPAPFPSVS